MAQKFSYPDAYPLHFSAQMNNIKLISEFYEKGVDINSLDNNKMTPLDIAINSSSMKSIKLLLEYGANANILDKERKTHLYHAMAALNIHYVKILLDGGASPLIYNAYWGGFPSGVEYAYRTIRVQWTDTEEKQKEIIKLIADWMTEREEKINRLLNSQIDMKPAGNRK